MLSEAIRIRGTAEHDSGPAPTVLVSRAAAVLELGPERSADADATAEGDAQPLQESVECDTEVNTCRAHQKSLLTLVTFPRDPLIRAYLQIAENPESFHGAEYLSGLSIRTIDQFPFGHSIISRPGRTDN
jgi:hypothetical protein